jgi:hypothetical protein
MEAYESRRGRTVYTMRLEPFYDKGPHRSLWADSRAAHGKIISGTLSCLNGPNECEILFRIYSVYAVLGMIKKSDRSCEKWRSITQSQGGGEYPTNDKERKANCTGHILRTNCLLKHVTEAKIQRGREVRGKRREEVSSYWMTLRKREDIENCMRKH